MCKSVRHARPLGLAFVRCGACICICVRTPAAQGAKRAGLCCAEASALSKSKLPYTFAPQLWCCSADGLADNALPAVPLAMPWPVLTGHRCGVGAHTCLASAHTRRACGRAVRLQRIRSMGPCGEAGMSQLPHLALAPSSLQSIARDTHRLPPAQWWLTAACSLRGMPWSYLRSAAHTAAWGASRALGGQLACRPPCCPVGGVAAHTYFVLCRPHSFIFVVRMPVCHVIVVN